MYGRSANWRGYWGGRPAACGWVGRLARTAAGSSAASGTAWSGWTATTRATRTAPARSGQAAAAGAPCARAAGTPRRENAAAVPRATSGNLRRPMSPTPGAGPASRTRSGRCTGPGRCGRPFACTVGIPPGLPRPPRGWPPVPDAAARLVGDMLGQPGAGRVPPETLPVGVPHVRPEEGGGKRQGEAPRRGRGEDRVIAAARRPRDGGVPPGRGGPLPRGDGVPPEVQGARAAPRRPGSLPRHVPGVRGQEGVHVVPEAPPDPARGAGALAVAPHLPPVDPRALGGPLGARQNS